MQAIKNIEELLFEHKEQFNNDVYLQLMNNLQLAYKTIETATEAQNSVVFIAAPRPMERFTFPPAPDEYDYAKSSENLENMHIEVYWPDGRKFERVMDQLLFDSLRSSSVQVNYTTLLFLIRSFETRHPEVRAYVMDNKHAMMLYATFVVDLVQTAIGEEPIYLQQRIGSALSGLVHGE
jgi:hypothetical protein